MDRVAWPARYREMIGNATVPILCYVTERRSLPGADDALDSAMRPERALERAIDRAIGAGADWIQVREKDLEAGALLKRWFDARSRRAVDARVFLSTIAWT